MVKLASRLRDAASRARRACWKRGGTPGADSDLVAAAYRGLLDRTPDAAGRTHWERLLSQGLSWDEFLRRLTSSDEYARYAVARLLGPMSGAGTLAHMELVTAVHQGLLGRVPDTQELSTWTERLVSGYAVEEFVREIAVSGEFVRITDARYGNPWLDLEASNADIVIDVPYFDDVLRLLGPAVDQSVMRSLVQHHGTWESEVTRFLFSATNTGDTALDIGANLGYFTLLMARRVGDTGRVIAFEPVGATAGYLRRNVDLNGLTNVHVLETALADDDGQRHVSVAGASLGSAHLAPLDASSGELVMAATLDRLDADGSVDLSGLRVIKLDIEGAEPLALRGMSRVLSTHHPIVVTEINSHALRRIGETVESLCAPLIEAGLRLHLLPTGDQDSHLGGLPRADAGGHVPLRAVPSLEVLIQIVRQLDRASPPAAVVELVAR